MCVKCPTRDKGTGLCAKRSEREGRLTQRLVRGAGSPCPVPVPAGQCAVLPAGAARRSCGGAQRQRHCPGSPRQAGAALSQAPLRVKQTWPARGDPEDAAHNMGNHLPLLPGNRLGPVPGSEEARPEAQVARRGRGGGRVVQNLLGAERDRGGSLLHLGSPSMRTRVWGGRGCPQRQGLVLSILCVPRTWLQGNGVKLGGERGRLRPPSIPDFLGLHPPPLRVTASSLSVPVSLALPQAFCVHFSILSSPCHCVVLTWWVRNELAG